MKVVAFNGSPRVGGNTEQAIRLVFEELHKHGIETELVQLGGRKVFGCLACGNCRKTRNDRCGRKDDVMNTYFQKMLEADGIILGSPVYFSNVSTEIKALSDTGAEYGAFASEAACVAASPLRRGDWNWSPPRTSCRSWTRYPAA